VKPLQHLPSLSSQPPSTRRAARGELAPGRGQRSHLSHSPLSSHCQRCDAFSFSVPFSSPYSQEVRRTGGIFRPNFEGLQVCNRVTQLPVLFTLVLHSNWAITGLNSHSETIFPCHAVIYCAGSVVCREALCSPRYVPKGFPKQMEDKALGCHTSLLWLLVNPPSCALCNTASFQDVLACSARDAPQGDSSQRIAAGFGSRPEHQVASSP